jgi:hypothetical protein
MIVKKKLYFSVKELHDSHIRRIITLGIASPYKKRPLNVETALFDL